MLSTTGQQYHYRFYINVRRLENLPQQYSNYRVVLSRSGQTAATDTFISYNGGADPNSSLEIDATFHSRPANLTQVLIQSAVQQNNIRNRHHPARDRNWRNYRKLVMQCSLHVPPPPPPRLARGKHGTGGEL
jgi:hypothetical protein